MWAIVINPISGRGKGAILGRRAMDFFDHHGIAYRMITGASSDHTSHNLTNFLTQEKECEGIVAVGGDGLVHLVLQHVANTLTPLAVIPAGTGNDFCRALGWPLEDIEQILRAATRRPSTRVDLGIIDGEWFGAILSTGFDSMVNERANIMKWPKGPAKYNLAILLELFRFKPRDYKIEIDGQMFSTKAMLIAIGNGQSYGGGMKVCPSADMTDDLLDVMVLSPISKLEFLRVFPKVYAGTHVKHPAVKILRGKRVRINSNAIAYADGERIGTLPVHAESVPLALLTWRP
jgi:diacylglycerol kinase (ATP)